MRCVYSDAVQDRIKGDVLVSSYADDLFGASISLVHVVGTFENDFEVALRSKEVARDDGFEHSTNKGDNLEMGSVMTDNVVVPGGHCSFRT